MTIQEVCIAIEAETRTRTWAEATHGLRILVIQSCIEGLNPMPEDAAKKLTKVRKVRKAKTKTDYPAMSQYAGLEASE